MSTLMEQFPRQAIIVNDECAVPAIILRELGTSFVRLGQKNMMFVTDGKQEGGDTIS